MSTSPSLDHGELFELHDPLAKHPLRLTTEGYSDWLTGEQAISLSRGELELERPLQLGGYMGRQITDFLWSGLTPLVVVSLRVVELLENHGFVGWATYPVEIYDRQGERLADYSGFAVTGKAGKRDRNRSMLVTKPAPTPGGKPYQVFKGFYFDESQWDSSDIFLAGGLRVVIRAVQKAFKRARVTNVYFTPLADVEIDMLLDKFDPEYPSRQ
jgi:hypothetical protein